MGVHRWTRGVRTATATTVLTSLLALSLACTSASPATPGDGAGTPPGAASPPPAQGTPKKTVDRLVLAVDPPSRETNEIRQASTPNGWHLQPMYESFLGVDENTGKRVPHLASAWKIEPDGKSIRFTFRKGVQFHNDFGEFTTKDIHHQPVEAAKQDTLSGVGPFWRDVLEKIEVVNDYEAVYHLTRADGNFLDYVSDQIGGMEMSSAKSFEQNGPATMTGQPIAGTGPYQFESREESAYIRFKKVPYKHWRTDVDFKEFEFRFMKEASTRLAALLAGEAHMTGLPEDLQQQTVQRGFKIITGKVAALRSFINFYAGALKDPKDPGKGLLDATSPLTNVKVRKALSQAVDRDALNKAFYAGKATKLINNPHHEVRDGWDPSWVQRFKDEYDYNPEAAKKLLEEAGYGPSNPAKVNMLLVRTTSISSAEDIAEAVADFWRKIGVDVELLQLDPASVTSGSRGGTLTNHAFVQATNSNQWVGTFNFGTALARCTGCAGNSGPEIWEVSQLLDQIRNTLDDNKMSSLWKQIGELNFTQHKFVPLFWHPVEVAVDPAVVGSWDLPGSISGNWTHIELIRAPK